MARGSFLVGRCTGQRFRGGVTLNLTEDIVGSPGPDSLIGNAGSNLIEGRADNDTIHGGSGSDLLLGMEGNDSILGESGENGLDSGPGSDSRNGGEGNDVCVNGESHSSCETTAAAALTAPPAESPVKLLGPPWRLGFDRHLIELSVDHDEASRLVASDR